MLRLERAWRFALVAAASLALAQTSNAVTLADGLTFSVADFFGGAPNVGSHFHSDSDGSFGGSLGGNATPNLAEIGGGLGLGETREEVRGLSEFDLSGIASGQTAFLNFRVFAPHGLTGPGDGGVFDIDIFAYDANNAEDLADYQAGTTALVGTFSTDGLGTGDYLDFDISTLLDSALLGGAASLGIRLQQSIRNTAGPTYTFHDFSITTTPVPEPTTASLVGLGLIALSRFPRVSRG